MFKIGDKVKVIDDDQKGIVKQIHQNRITIENEFGFEEIYLSHEILLDESLEISHVEMDFSEKSKSKPRGNPLSEIKEIDLHIGQLVDSYKNLSNYEMLQIQLQTIENEVELARTERRNRLVFIHGHGSGKLKEEMMNLLNRYKGIEIYDASYRKFRGGATEVKFR
ncbi:KOW domain-containing RNA-binding protein [Moheibacter lacus]|uniref:Smr domain-containing protein n=1 Tax=Moheibacter lacus TaxID=2745851 RepID=A0A838ZPP7_9FLAO|nr:hypothetical protein [Moheibacter lacus]MBA5629497.1 hypothetical protein [Moheibacter lacus]